MGRDDDGYDDDEAGDHETEAFYISLVPDEARRRYWAERGRCDQREDELPAGSVLFADRDAEMELRREIRLSELWNRCQGGLCTIEEFRQLSTLITQVDGIRGSLCIDCAMLDRPNVSANWALASTMLCRGHLRFRLSHAHIDGGSSSRSA
jgi:hypothetical protein